MPVTRRATENENTVWVPLPEIPLATFVLAKPSLRFSDTFGTWSINFGLALHPDSRAQFLPKRELPKNTQQSDRAFYSAGPSVGYFKDGAYVTTKLVDFMAACFGLEGGKKFRDWIEGGGGFPRPIDRDDDKAELQMMEDWLSWMEGLQVYGSIRHEKDKQNAGQVRARFGGPLPLGSLPGTPEAEYQALALGKFRSMRVETEQADNAYEESKKVKSIKGKALTPDNALPEAPPVQQFTADGDAVAEAKFEAAAAADDDDESPPF